MVSIGVVMQEPYPVNGPSVRAIDFIKCLSHKHELHLFIPMYNLSQESMKIQKEFLQNEFQGNVCVHTLSQTNSLNKRFVFISCFKEILKYKDRIDVFYFLSYEKSLFGAFIKLIARIKICSDLHAIAYLEQSSGIKRKITKLLEIFILKRSDVILVSTNEAKLLYTVLGGKNIHVIPNCVHIDDDDVPKNVFNIRQPKIAFLGSPTKANKLALLDTQKFGKKLITLGFNPTFLIFGDWSVPPVDCNFFQFMGYVPDLLHELRKCDLSAHPFFAERYTHKSYGIRSRTVLYLQAGLPVITSPDGACGLDFAVRAGAIQLGRTIDELAEKTKVALQSPPTLSFMSRMAIQSLQRMDSNHIEKQLILAFKSVR